MDSFFVFLAASQLVLACGQLQAVERTTLQETPEENNDVLSSAFMIILVLAVCCLGLCTPVVIVLIKNPSVICDIFWWMVPTLPDFGSTTLGPDNSSRLTSAKLGVHDIEDDLEQQMKADFRDIHNDLSRLRDSANGKVVAKSDRVYLPGMPHNDLDEDQDINQDLEQGHSSFGRADSAPSVDETQSFSRGVTPDEADQHPGAKKGKRRPLGLKLDTTQGFSRQVTPENEEENEAVMRIFGHGTDDAASSVSSEPLSPASPVTPKRKKKNRSGTASPKARSKSPKQSPRKEDPATLREQSPAGSTQGFSRQVTPENGFSRQVTPENGSNPNFAPKRTLSELWAQHDDVSPKNAKNPPQAMVEESRPSLSSRGLEELSRMAVGNRRRRPSLSPEARQSSPPRLGTTQSELSPSVTKQNSLTRVNKQESTKSSPPASRAPSITETTNQARATSPLAGGREGRRPSNASEILRERPSSPPGSSKGSRPSNAHVDSKEEVASPKPPARMQAVSPPRSDMRRFLDVDEPKSPTSPKRRLLETKPSGPPMEIPRAEAWSGQLQQGNNQRFQRYMLNFRSKGKACEIVGSSQGAQIKGHFDQLSKLVSWKELHSWGFVIVSGNVEEITPGSYKLTGQFQTSRGEPGTILLSSDRAASGIS